MNIFDSSSTQLLQGKQKPSRHRDVASQTSLAPFSISHPPRAERTDYNLNMEKRNAADGEVRVKCACVKTFSFEKK